MNNIAKSVSKAARDLMYTHQFYAYFLNTLNKVESKEVPTAGVSKQGINVQLSINPEFWEKLPDKIKTGVLHHELLHICLMHLELRDKYPDKILFNIAAD